MRELLKHKSRYGGKWRELKIERINVRGESGNVVG
jgi:hypothetical protein